MRIRSKKSTSPTLPPGRRVYAIGDVHGEGDLLRRMLQLIKADNDARGDAKVTLVLLGDLIDRGPDAADLLATFARLKMDDVVMIKGNHEAALMDSYRGNREVLLEWLPFGAASTLAGFGITTRDIDSPIAVFEAALRKRIDLDLVEWLETLPSAWECGDYYFTHAGIRPGVELEEQDELDLLWIREPFLSSRRRHGKIIVHGHTVEPGLPSLGGNRIGIDTGAYEHGVLTALGLEGGQQWLLQSKVGDAERSADSILAKARQAPSLAMRARADDIETLIASIVTPRGQASDTAHSRRIPSLSTLILRSPLGRAKGLGKKGYVAVGFALGAAVLGGAAAIWQRHAPSTIEGGATIAIPGIAGNGGLSPPAGPWGTPTKGPTRKNGGTRRFTGRLAGDAPKSDGTESSPADSPSPTLYGDALANALEEDRATTRRLNLDELSRNQAQTDPQK